MSNIKERISDLGAQIKNFDHERFVTIMAQFLFLNAAQFFSVQFFSPLTDGKTVSDSDIAKSFALSKMCLFFCGLYIPIMFLQEKHILPFRSAMTYVVAAIGSHSFFDGKKTEAGLFFSSVLISFAESCSSLRVELVREGDNLSKKDGFWKKLTTTVGIKYVSVDENVDPPEILIGNPSPAQTSFVNRIGEERETDNLLRYRGVDSTDSFVDRIEEEGSNTPRNRLKSPRKI